MSMMVMNSSTRPVELNCRQEWKCFCKIVEECSSKLVSQALSGLTMKEWIDKVGIRYINLRCL